MWRSWFLGGLVILASMLACTNSNEKQFPLELTAAEQILLQAWNTELDKLSKEVNLLEDDLSKSIFLRNYCSGIADYGKQSEASNAYFQQQNWDSLSMASVHDVFIKDSMPGTCGPLSSFYCTLLSYFNIPCVLYDHGLDAPLSHVLSLVQINDGDTTKIIIQDPHYAMMYVDNTGSPLDFFTFIDLIRSQSYDKIKMDDDTIATHIVFDEETIKMVREGMKNDSCKNFVDGLIQNKTYVVSANRTYEYMMNNPCSPYREFIKKGLKAQGQPSNILHAFLLNGETRDITGKSNDLMTIINQTLNH